MRDDSESDSVSETDSSIFLPSLSPLSLTSLPTTSLTTFTSTTTTTSTAFSSITTSFSCLPSTSFVSSMVSLLSNPSPAPSLPQSPVPSPVPLSVSEPIPSPVEDPVLEPELSLPPVQEPVLLPVLELAPTLPPTVAAAKKSPNISTLLTIVDKLATRYGPFRDMTDPFPYEDWKTLARPNWK